MVDATTIPARLTGAGLPQVVTVHDLTLLTHPEWHEASKVRWFGWAMRRAVKAATRVLCVSQTTAADLAAAIAKLATDPAARQDAARGRARAAGFTWARCAELTAASARALL